MKQDQVSSITYFTEPGKKNTMKTLEIAKEKAVNDDVKTILVASTLGYTIKRALELFKDIDVRFIVVGGRKRQFPEDLYEVLVDGGHLVLFNSDYDFDYPNLVWEILRRFCEGMKVCVQMVLIVSDLGLLSVGEEVISIAGTGRVDFKTGGGADTAIVIETVKSPEFFELDLPQSQTKIMGRKVKEILCKPR